MKNILPESLKLILTWSLCSFVVFATLFLIVVFTTILFRLSEYIMMVGILE